MGKFTEEDWFWIFGAVLPFLGIVSIIVMALIVGVSD